MTDVIEDLYCTEEEWTEATGDRPLAELETHQVHHPGSQGLRPAAARGDAATPP